MSKDLDLDDLELAGLTDAQLAELSEYIDPDVSCREHTHTHTHREREIRRGREVIDDSVLISATYMHVLLRDYQTYYITYVGIVNSVLMKCGDVCFQLSVRWYLHPTLFFPPSLTE